MFGTIIKFLGGNQIAVIGALVVIAAVGGYIGWLKIDISGLNDDVSRLELQVQTLKNDVYHGELEVAKCKGTIEATNDRINDLRTDVQNRSEIIGMLADNIATVQKITKKNIEGIENLPTPKNCKEAMAMLREGAGK